jgi:hypothetical protein
VKAHLKLCVTNLILDAYHLSHYKLKQRMVIDETPTSSYSREHLP